MMKSRQSKSRAPTRLLQATAVFPYLLVKQHETEMHRHDFNQLIYASEGCLRVTSENQVWVIPPYRAVWAPAQIEHQVLAISEAKMTTLFTHIKRGIVLPLNRCIAVSITPLLKALLEEASLFRDQYKQNSPQSRLLRVILDQLNLSQQQALVLPTLKNLKLKKFAAYLQQHPSDMRSLDDWGKELGASSRTLARLFQKDVGMSFLRWRTQFKLLKAIEWLAQGQSIQQISEQLGYANPGAFIHRFHSELGMTPTAYFREP